MVKSWLEEDMITVKIWIGIWQFRSGPVTALIMWWFHYDAHSLGHSDRSPDMDGSGLKILAEWPAAGPPTVFSTRWSCSSIPLNCCVMLRCSWPGWKSTTAWRVNSPPAPARSLMRSPYRQIQSALQCTFQRIMTNWIYRERKTSCSTNLDRSHFAKTSC